MPTAPGRLRRLLAAPALHRVGPFVLLAAVLLYYAGYVKDDAYISLRYAANWARGLGPVFNPGELVEGYTNFLWTATLAALLRLGAPPLLAAKLLGALTALLGLHWVRRLAAGDATAHDTAAGDRAAWLFAASPTLGLWAASGLEPTAAAALCAGAALLARRAAANGRWRDGALCGLGLAACALLRPEGHLVALALLPLAPRALPTLLLVLVPYHLWRWSTFGDWLPNTFHVKGHAASLRQAAEYVGLWLLFYGHGLLLALALLAARARRGREAVLHAGLALAFVGYLAWIGDDEMRWFRLYAPALPFLLALAARALPWRVLPLFLLFGLIAHGAGWPLRDYLAQDHRAYFPLGAAIAARARPGDRAVFQDMGATPFHARDVSFRDPLGLVDRRVAELYRAARWSPFRGAGPPELERALRDHLLGGAPRFIAFVAYVERPERAAVRERFARAPEETLRPLLADNPYAHDIARDPRFTSRYRFVAAWRRNDGYYLVLYERP